MQEDGVVPRRRGARGRRADVEPQPEHEQEFDDMDVQQQQQTEKEEEEELEVLEEDMEDGELQQRRRGKRPMVPDPEPLDDYPGGTYDIVVEVQCARGQEGV